MHSKWRFSDIFSLLLATCLTWQPASALPQDAAPADSTRQKNTTEQDLPLVPDRTWNFTTDEGSWLSLDVSPDGHTIVFDLLGDLYTLPITGGQADTLTSGVPFDAQPRFSPDGKKILFVSDRNGGQNMWTVDLDSKDMKQLTKGKHNRYESPSWSPDGKYVAVSKGEGRFGPTKMWLQHVDGGSGVGLVKSPDNLRTLGAAFTPDGRYIWHAQRTGTWQYNANMPQYQLAVYDRKTGIRSTRTYRYGSAFRPTISPDGKWLVYGTRHEAQTGLRIREMATGEERWLAYPVQHDDQEAVAERDVLPGMAFMPDSQSLLASYGGKIWRVPVDGSDAILIPFTAHVSLGLGPKVIFDYPIEDTPRFVVREIRDAVLSPDGAKLAFTALNRLYVMDYPDGVPQRLTNREDTEAQPTWSPNGQWLAYVTWSDDGGGHIRRILSDGRLQSRQLTTLSAIYQQVAWSPDGQRIVAVRGPARAYFESTGPTAPGAATDLIWVPANGGDVTFIAPSEGRIRPHFTQDANRIYLSHRRNGLSSIRWDGTDEKFHLKVTGEKRPGAQEPNLPRELRMAPAGDQALAYLNHDLYAVTVPYVGGETPSISLAKPENASFPVRKLTDIGAQFPAWRSDGRKVHWSLGNALFVFDLDSAKVVDERIEERKKVLTKQDSTSAGTDSGLGEKYTPDESRIRIEVSRDIPVGVVILTGARIITMNGDEIIENGDILIRNNRIEAVGASGTLSVPDGARSFDLPGKTIVPGLVDPHAHMWPTWGIHKTQIWMYHANLAYGVTTTRDPQTSQTDVITYGDMVDAGMMVGPRVYSTGPGVFGDYANDRIRDMDHAKDIIRRYSDYYDTKTVKMYMAGNRQQRQWVIMAAREAGLMVTTEGGLDLMYNLTMMIDGYSGQEHSFPIFPLYKDVVHLTAETGITYTPTLLVSYGGPFGEGYFLTRENPHDDEKLRRFTPHSVIDDRTRRRSTGGAGWFLEEEHVFQEHAKVIKAVLEAGGRAGVGSHGQLQGLGYHWELWAMASGGLNEHDALRAATIYGAESIGLGKEVGTLEVGKLADLVVLNANPLEDLRNTNTIRYVMKNGRLYEGDTLNEIWPRERAFAPQKQDDPSSDLKAGIR